MVGGVGGVREHGRWVWGMGTWWGGGGKGYEVTKANPLHSAINKRSMGLVLLVLLDHLAYDIQDKCHRQ